MHGELFRDLKSRFAHQSMQMRIPVPCIKVFFELFRFALHDDVAILAVIDPLPHAIA